MTNALHSISINTFLLKFQYKHINNLDDKPNEVTVSLVALEKKFDLLNEKIEHTKKALNKNMFMLMGMMGFFLRLSKVLDIFVK